MGERIRVCLCTTGVGYLAYLVRFLMLYNQRVEARGEALEHGLSGGRAISRWREYMLYLMDHSILPMLEGAAVGAREGSV
jgi:hypothetical protein